MKVLLLNKAYPPVIGGIERHVETLARGLAGHGIEVVVVVCNQGWRRAVIEEGGLKVIKLPSPGKVASMHLGPTTPLWVRRLRVDLIHAHLPYPMADLSTWLARPPVPVIATWHSEIVRQRRLLRLYRPLQDWFLRRADRILVTSPPLLEHSPTLRPFRRKCRIVPMGIECGRFAPRPNVIERAMTIRVSMGQPIVLFVGRLVKYKGLEFLVRAMPAVNACLIVVGEGPLDHHLKSLCHALNLDTSIRFTGAVTDVELTAFFHACDLLVLPSVGNNEAFGLVQLEAMACGKPVVSTNLPTGVPYVNVHAETGLVVPPGDTRALASAIGSLLADPKRRDELGQRGRERVQRLFTAQRMVDDVVGQYREVLAESGSGAGRMQPLGSAAR